MTFSSILLLVLFLILLAGATFYNRLVAHRQGCLRAFADIDVMLRRRCDLVPNLVETVQGYAAHEEELFTKVTEARAEAMRTTETHLFERQEAETALSGALMSLMAVAENYPDLKANENFMALQTELSEIETAIAQMRMAYNNAVTTYNTTREQVPFNIIATLFSFDAFEPFTLGEARSVVEKPPQVQMKPEAAAEPVEPAAPATEPTEPTEPT